MSWVTPPQSTVCSPKRSVSVSSANDVSTMPARAAPIAAPYANASSRARAGRVLRDGDHRRRAVPLRVQAADDVARAFRRDHDHVVAGRRRDAAVVDVEAVREEERGAWLEVGCDLLLVQRRLRAVGNEERDELSTLDRVGDGSDGQPRLLGRGHGRAALAQADHDVDARVGHVERMGVALAPVAEHRDLAVEQVEVAGLVDLRHRFGSFQTWRGWIAVRPRRRREADAPGASELAHAVGTDELFERLDLVGAPDDLEGHRVAADVGDSAPATWLSATRSGRRSGATLTVTSASSRSIESSGPAPSRGAR